MATKTPSRKPTVRPAEDSRESTRPAASSLHHTKNDLPEAHQQDVPSPVAGTKSRRR